MARLLPSALEPGARIPPFALPGPGGRTYRPADFRGRRNLALVFIRDAACGPCQEVLREFAAEHREYVERHVQVLAVVPGGPDVAARLGDRLGLPYPVLADPEGAAWRAYLGPSAERAEAAVFCTDRYGVLEEQAVREDALTLPAQADFLAWFDYIEVQRGAPFDLEPGEPRT
jgi:peroxiredoxin